MKKTLFAFVLLFSVFQQSSQSQAQELLDLVSAKDASGYVPDDILMDVVHSLTPDARKQVHSLRERISKRTVDLNETREAVNQAEKALSTKSTAYQQARSNVMKYEQCINCLLYTSPSPRDQRGSRMPSSA